MAHIKQIARDLIEAVLYDNDFVNREEPLEESKVSPWVDKVVNSLTTPVQELGLDYFTDEWIEHFACNDDDFMTTEVINHPCLKPLDEVLNELFEQY